MRKMWYCILVLICVLKGGGTVRRKRRIMSGLLALCIALSVLPLSACTAPKLTLDPEELYALPELPERYTALNKQLSAIQESGAEYAAPVSGSNIQPVQMMDLDGDGLFISVGRTPVTELVRGQLELDPGGYILAGETTETNIPGVFAVGDVRTKRLRQVVTAVADGAMAVHMAEEYLAGGT